MRSLLLTLAWSMALFCGVRAGAKDARAVSFEYLLDEMTDRTHLAEWPDPAYRCVQFSSYDRRSTTPNDPETWFANGDAGNFIRIEDRNGRREAVMADAAGPGAIVRFWSANPAGTIRFYLDDDDAPALEAPMADLLGGRGPVPAPLAAERARGFNLYLPIPFARRCVITTDAPDGLYYHINVRQYPPGTAVQALEPRVLIERPVLLQQAAAKLAVTDVEVIFRTNSSGILQPGQSIDLFSTLQGGAFTKISLGLDRRDRSIDLRSCLLIIECDGVRTVHAPVADFFSWTWGTQPFESWPIDVDAHFVLTSRWFMPFQRGARVRLANLGDRPLTAEWEIAMNEYKWNDRSMHFHAVWRAESMSTRPRKDWNYATIQGQGVWVGDALAVANPVAAWWGEGDEKIFVDRESSPSHFGTGTEDYYGYAWSSPQIFSAPFHNQTRCDGPGNFGHTFVHRFRSLDAIPFTQQLKFDMEVWHWAQCNVQYAATSFFYLRPGGSHNVEQVDDPVALRRPQLELKVFKRPGMIEAELLKVLRASDGVETVVQQLGDGSEGSWSGMRQLWCKARRVGDFVELAVSVENPGRREVVIWLTRSWDYGVIQCFVNGAKAGEPIDTFNSQHPDQVGVPQPHSLGVFDLSGGTAMLRIKVVGGNSASKPPHYFFGLDGVELK